MGEETPEKPKMFFGEMVIIKKLMTVDQVEECLRIQDGLKTEGQYKTLGAIMHDRGYLNLFQVEEILKELGRSEEERESIPGCVILGVLGQGATGTVYKGLQHQVNREVAIKILSPRVAQNEDFVGRFLREMKVLAQINHMNIITVYGAGESKGYYYFIMEYVDGHPLDQLIRQEKKIHERLALDYTRQIASALQHIHEHELVHRDIKPQNILIGFGNVSKLCDLGLTKTQGDTKLTKAGMILGSPSYMAPEQAQAVEADIRTDIYGLGASLYHMVCGKPPFGGRMAIEILDAVIQGYFPKPTTANPDVSEPCEAIILKAMAREREDRYQTPREMADEIKELLQTSTIQRIVDDSFGSKIKGWFKRK